MNQILQTENKKNKGPVEIKKVVIFFAIAIIIFAVILIGLGSFAILNKKDNQNEIGTQGEEQKPEVNINRENDDIIVEVKHQKPISKITYKWNEEEEKVIAGQNKTELSEKISLPYGTNTLNLTVVDIEGQETKFQKEYVVDGDGKPVIDLKLTTENKIKITVQDEKKLSNISYKWNDGEETKIEASQDNPKLIEQEIEIPLGQNTLKVQAVNVNNVSISKELEVKGIKKPVVNFRKEGDYLVIRAEDEVGMKIVNYTLNGQKYQLNYGNKKVVEYKQKLEKGDNNLELTAENQDGGITVKKVLCKN